MLNSPQKVKKMIKDPKKLKQVDSWKQSDLSKVSSTIHKKERASFEITTEFLDNCINFHKDDIEYMLSLGVDINCVDKDNLTALHQACINAKLELVEYLISKNANINVVDNEGWTPLHIAASIGSLELARFLIDKGARLDLVNYEGDLPVALVDDEEHHDLKVYLQREMKKRNINEEHCRYMERNVMMEDVLKWKSTGIYEPPMDESIKFTPLHVAASKNYLDVLTELTPLLSKDELNAQDSDGWTALHAAAHWGNREACIILVKAGADLDIVTKANETVIDIMDPDIKESLVEDLKQFQMENLRTIANQVAVRNEGTNKRRTSIIRQSVQMKMNVKQRDPVMERKIHDAAQNYDISSTSSSIDDEFSPRPNDTDSRKQNIGSISEGDESSGSSLHYDNKSHSTISVTSPLDSCRKESSNVTDQTSKVANVKDQSSNKSSLVLDVVATHPVLGGDINNEEINVHNSANDNNACVRDMAESDLFVNISGENVVLRPKSDRDSIVERRNTTNRMSLVMAPSKCDESESFRREKARRIRSNRRSTQGINLETVESIKRRQNEIENGTLATMKEPNSPIPEENALDVVDGVSTSDQTSDIIVDNSVPNAIVNLSAQKPQEEPPQQHQQNDSTFSTMVPKYRISNALGSFLKTSTSNNNAPLNTTTKPESPSNTTVVAPMTRVDDNKSSGTASTEYRPNITRRVIASNVTNLNKQGESGSYVARPMSGTTRMRSNEDSPAVPNLRSCVSAVSSTRANLKFQNSVNTVDNMCNDYNQPCRTIVNSLTNNQIIIKEQNSEIAKLKLRIQELENSQKNGTQQTKTLDDETELSRIKKENETLKTQNESLLRVIGKIQQELHSIHPLSLNN